MNPKNGGNPPRERKFIINKNLIFFLLLKIFSNCFIKKILNFLKIKIIFTLINLYVKK